MKNTIQRLAEHLRLRKSSVVRSVEMRAQEYDPTYGWTTRTISLEVVDFDMLLAEIDSFGEQLRKERG